MTRRQKDPLRPLTDQERNLLTHIGRSYTEPAAHVARAKALLAVADGSSYTNAARAAGRRSGDAVSQLVSRFNREGLAAVEPGHGGGPIPTYELRERERILAEARREPDREADGTATWSLNTLCRALRRAPDGLPEVSTHTIIKVLHEAGFSWQKTRGWCETGKVMRKRKSGVVEVTDLDAVPKKLDRAGLPARREEARLGCVGNGSGRSLSDETLPGKQLGARRQAGVSASPVFPRGYGQTVGVVPSGQWKSAG